LRLLTHAYRRRVGDLYRQVAVAGLLASPHTRLPAAGYTGDTTRWPAGPRGGVGGMASIAAAGLAWAHPAAAGTVRRGGAPACWLPLAQWPLGPCRLHAVLGGRQVL